MSKIRSRIKIKSGFLEVGASSALENVVHDKACAERRSANLFSHPRCIRLDSRGQRFASLDEQHGRPGLARSNKNPDPRETVRPRASATFVKLTLPCPGLCKLLGLRPDNISLKRKSSGLSFPKSLSTLACNPASGQTKMLHGAAPHRLLVVPLATPAHAKVSLGNQLK